MIVPSDSCDDNAQDELCSRKRGHDESSYSDSAPEVIEPSRKKPRTVTFKSTLFTSPVKSRSSEEMESLPRKSILRKSPSSPVSTEIVSSDVTISSLSSWSDESIVDAPEEILAKHFSDIMRECLDLLESQHSEMMGDFMETILYNSFKYLISYYDCFCDFTHGISEVVPAFPMLYLSLQFADDLHTAAERFLTMLLDMSVDDVFAVLVRSLRNHIHYTELYLSNKQILLDCIQIIFYGKPYLNDLSARLVKGFTSEVYSYNFAIKEIADWVSSTRNFSASSGMLSCLVYDIRQFLKKINVSSDTLTKKIEFFLHEHTGYERIIPYIFDTVLDSNQGAIKL